MSKTENQMLKKGKIRKPQQTPKPKNQKTEVFRCKNRKADLKNGQNRKTENPNAPLLQTTFVTIVETFPPFPLVNVGNDKI